MGPELVACLVTLAVLLVPVGAWLGTRSTRRELADERLTAERWAAHLGAWEEDLRRREQALLYAVTGRAAL